METSESKKDRFKRLASSRTNAVIEKLEILGNCSNRSNYEYTEEEVKQMLLAIERKLNEVKVLFSQAASKDNSFHF
ncbi:MAG TPA: hypothetical protein PLY88_00770 [Candidatus Omnitrophota bacterium]|nr:hypothetical protein [Candidatus Omnitrophota bacterium]HRK61065.1 hypothetical protein [Candidatus Omnitrophota bacterium]